MRIRASERTWALLGYLPALFWIPVLFKRDSLFVQFHGRQAMVLFLLWFVALIVLVILLALAERQAILQMTLLFLVMLATLLYGLLALAGIIKAGLGERYRMPVVADVALALRL